MKQIKFHQAWFYLGLIWIALIIYLSLTPASPVPSHWWDKAQHFAAYSFLTLWFFIISYSTKISTRYAMAFILLGILLEGLQGLVPNRFPSLWDIFANSLGVVLIWVFVKLIFTLRDKTFTRP